MDTAEDKHLVGNTSGDEEYTRKYDAYRPKFVGIPEGDFPNTWGNVVLIYTLLALLYILVAGVFAFLLWLLFLDVEVVSWVYAGLGGLYAGCIMLLIFYGQTIRSKLEKRYMQEALEHHAKVADQTRT